MRRRLIQVFEHERLTIHEDDMGRFLHEHELIKLYDYNDRNKNIYFTGIRDGIKFSNYVGVIQIGGLTLEILPKADKKLYNQKKDYDAWQAVLLRMLAVCNRINVQSVSEAKISRHYNSLLDLYFILYLNELSQLIHQGLIKKYRNTNGNLNALKGRIIFPKNIQHNLIHQERIYTDHQLYDYEHLLNQVLLKGLSLLSIIASNPLIIDRIHRVRLDFPEIKEIHIKESHFEKLIINRKSEPYRRALDIARMIILNYRPDIKCGSENMLALLFDMNKLWEEYVLRMLKRCETADIKVLGQIPKHFWEDRKIRPDIVVEVKNNGIPKTYIIDTKWKIIENNDISDDDLRQMFTYNAYWGAEKSVLLYPKTKDQPEKFGVFHKGIPDITKCKLGFINVMNEDGELNMDIGKDILDKL